MFLVKKSSDLNLEYSVWFCSLRDFLDQIGLIIIALSSNALRYPHTKFKAEYLKIGVETYVVDGVEIPIFNKERTIIDLLRIDKPFEAMINEDEFFGNWSHQAVGWV